MLQHQLSPLQTERPRFVLPNRHQWRFNEEERTLQYSCCFLVRDHLTKYWVRVLFLNMRYSCASILSAVHTEVWPSGSRATVGWCGWTVHRPICTVSKVKHITHYGNDILVAQLAGRQPGSSFSPSGKDRSIWAWACVIPLESNCLVPPLLFCL